MSRIYGFLLLALLAPLIAGFYLSGGPAAPRDEKKTMSQEEDLACRRIILKQFSGAVKAAESDLVITRHLETRCAADADGRLIRITRHEVVASFKECFCPGDEIEWRSASGNNEKSAAVMAVFNTGEAGTAHFMELPVALQAQAPAKESSPRRFTPETYTPVTQAVKLPSERATIAFDTFYALKEDAKLSLH
ncbi:MAG: hypothetical protein AB7F32_02145 [Victivallaceae bacterium]